MFHGHLWVANGALGIEGFVHGGHQYTYFGLFPSLLRMPILLVTSSLDGKLTASLHLVAWLVTGLFVSLLIWRVRVLVRGDRRHGLGGGDAYGVAGGHHPGRHRVHVAGRQPYVFNEDLAWSICLTVGSLFALLGVIERPSWGRVTLAGVLILAANLDRVDHRMGLRGRRRADRVLVRLGAGRAGDTAGGALPVARRRPGSPGGRLCGQLRQVRCPVRRLEFRPGLDPGQRLPTRSSWPPTTTPRRASIFVPSNLLAYLRPDGIRFTSVFPFITLPAGPPPGTGGGALRPSVPHGQPTASMPLLFLLSCWGMVTAFRPRPVGRGGPDPHPAPGRGHRRGRPVRCGATSPRGTWRTSCRSWSWPARWPWPTSGGVLPVPHRPARIGDSWWSSAWSGCSPSPPTSAWPSRPTRSGTRPRPATTSQAEGGQRRDRPSHRCPRAAGQQLARVGSGRSAVHRGDCDGLYVSNGEDFAPFRTSSTTAPPGWWWNGGTGSSTPIA